MSTSDDRPPSIDERYTSATHAKKLTVAPDHAGAADMLIAAGWSPSRLGAALLRLVSEWDGAEKPQPPNARATDILSAAIARERGRVKASQEDQTEARQQAAQWLEHEHKMLIGKLRTLPEVRAHLTAWVRQQQAHDPEQVAAEVLMWWLDSTCRACHGRRWELMQDTRRLSNRMCPVCRGSGERPRPGGLLTNKVLAYLDDCVSAGRASMRGRLRSTGRR